MLIEMILMEILMSIPITIVVVGLTISIYRRYRRKAGGDAKLKT